MKIKDRMSPDPVTIAPEASVDEALGVMRTKGVRHLPVLQDGRLVGLVTDTQLSTAWFPSLLEDLTVKDVMESDPPCIAASQNVYQAARMLYHQKLTGLLVMDGERLVGIITLADILRVFVEMMGLLRESVRINVAIDPSYQSVEDVHALIRAQGGDVISVALVHSSPGRREYVFRLEEIPPGPILEALGQAGVELLD